MTSGHTTEDDGLRSLMHDAVSDVDPPEGLGAIRSRTMVRSAPSPTRWLPLAVAAAAAVVLVIAGAAWVAHLGSRDTPAASPASTPGRDLTVSVSYVGATAAGPRLFTEHHVVRDTTDSPLQAAVSEALGSAPADPDYRNDLRALGVTATATASGGTVTLDLSGPLDRPAGMSEETAQVVIQSLVWTADQATASDSPVQFTVHGDDVQQVLGLDATRPVAKASADSVLSTISIQSPTQGAHVPTTFEVHGQAATFEANVVWELKQGGHVVKHGFTTAAQCCTLSPYSFTVTAPPGQYTLVVHDVNDSNGEGIGTSQDTKDVTLQ